MTWLLQLVGAFASMAFLKPFLTRVMIALGIGVVTFAGVTVGFDAALSFITDSYGRVPADVVGFLNLMNLPKALNVILSAYSSAAAVKGLTAVGSLKRAVWRPGQSGDLFGAG